MYSQYEEDSVPDQEDALVPEKCDRADSEYKLVFDENGILIAREPLSPRPELFPLIRPCSIGVLNGSWFIQITPTFPQIMSQIRGAMRIESSSSTLRVSGDIYVKPIFLRPIPGPIGSATVERPQLIESIPPGVLFIRKNWYPAFPQKEYRWYFRSLGCTYSHGKLTFKFERHLWNMSAQEFTAVDTGSIELDCSTSLIHYVGWPQPSLEMKGTAIIGGKKYNVTASKTSPYYRGCLVEVDVMKNRSFPSSATSCGNNQTYSFTGVYREAGLDFHVQVNELDLPEDPLLTTAEMHNLLTTHRSLSAGGDNWHLWLLVGSRMDGTLGLMFDTDNPPHREGSVGFYDPTLPDISIIESSARGQKLGEVPLAFLRTLIHEAGHAFNLYHPKHDTHSVPIGTTIMNQTGDVMSFASSTNPYPCNATMAFNDHNRTSLIHSPDPQVKPGWKEFGWGHGSAWSGIAEPIDAVGLNGNAPAADGLHLHLELPTEIVRGEVVFAAATVVNEDSVPRHISAGLNLAEGDLTLNAILPNGQVAGVKDVVLLCGDRRVVELNPGDSHTGTFQILYTNQGFTFDQPGRYTLWAELATGEADGSVVRSDPVDVYVRASISEAERDIASLVLDPEVGLSFAFGDFGDSTEAQNKLTTVMERYGDTETGAAAAMVLANALARDFRDPRSGRTLRQADRANADRALDTAMQGLDATSLAKYASAVVSPREQTAPILDMVQGQLSKPLKGRFGKDDLDQAKKIISDFLE